MKIGIELSVSIKSLSDIGRQSWLPKCIHFDVLPDQMAVWTLSKHIHAIPDQMAVWTLSEHIHSLPDQIADGDGLICKPVINKYRRDLSASAMLADTSLPWWYLSPVFGVNLYNLVNFF